MSLHAQLPHLHYFWLVAKNGSFTRAAEQLHISQSAVSYQIKKLEEKLGFLLFARDSRHRARLTKEGEQLASRCQTIFKSLEETTDALAGDSTSGSLTVTAPVALGSLVIAPVLKSLRDKYPELDVDLHLTDEIVDFFSSNVDLAIRFFRPPPKLNSHLLFRMKKVLVASTEYLKDRPAINSLQDLSDHRLVLRDSTDYSWRAIIEVMPDFNLPELTDTVRINNVFGMAEAVRAHLGLCLLPAYVVNDDIQRGDMQTVLPEIFDQIAAPYYACRPASPYQNAKIQVFIDALQEYLAQPKFSNAVALNK